MDTTSELEFIKFFYNTNHFPLLEILISFIKILGLKWKKLKYVTVEIDVGNSNERCLGDDGPLH